MTDTKPTSQNRRNEKQTRYLSQAIQLEEAVNPHIIRSTMTMVSLAILIFLVWAGFTNINEVARTPGEVVPHGYQQTVQHLEGGIIGDILVQEGDVVKEGQVVIVFNEASLREDMERMASKQESLELQAERLRAFVEEREPDFSSLSGVSDATITDQKAFFEGMKSARDKEADILRNQIAEKKQAIQTLQHDLGMTRKNYAIALEMYTKRKTLNDKGYISDLKLLEDEQRVNESRAAIVRLENQIIAAKNANDEFENRLVSLSARHRDEAYEKLSLVETEKVQNSKLISKLEERIGRLQVRAPSDGLVKGLAVNTIGSVVQSGQTLMEIVPLEKSLEVQVKISPRDIGHIVVGQPVQVKVSSYDFARYGTVEGKVEQISATTFTGDNGERYYQGRIALSRSYVGANDRNLVLPGMTVMADIITGDKTILQYLLKPIHLSLKTAFTER